MMSGDLPVTSDADAMAKQKAKEAELAGGGTMLASGSTKRKADQVRERGDVCHGGGGGGVECNPCPTIFSPLADGVMCDV